MTKKIFIQKEDKEFTEDFCFEAYNAFRYMNWWLREEKYELITINLADLQSHKFSKDNLYVGTVEFMREVFYQLNVPIPRAINIPYSLWKFAGRKVGIEHVDKLDYPVFIKPAYYTKEFEPVVARKRKDIDFYLPKLDGSGNTVFFSEVENFVSEYRCFVFKGKMRAIKHYLGEFDLFMSWGCVQQAIANYEDAPIAYTLDIGITDKGDTKIIECNDFWSCGTYGFGGQVYADMLLARWNQIVGV